MFRTILIDPFVTEEWNNARNTKGGSITVPLTSCLTGLELAVWQLTMFCFYLQNRLIQTSQTGGQSYIHTSPFSIPWKMSFSWLLKLDFPTISMFDCCKWKICCRLLPDLQWWRSVRSLWGSVLFMIPRWLHVGQNMLARVFVFGKFFQASLISLSEAEASPIKHQIFVKYWKWTNFPNKLVPFLLSLSIERQTH